MNANQGVNSSFKLRTFRKGFQLFIPFSRIFD